MKRVVWAAIAASAALLVGCNSAHISLGQPNAVSVPVGTTYEFDALVQDSNGIPLWRLDGPGSLSNTSGPTIFYIAPSTFDPNATQATLTVYAVDGTAPAVVNGAEKPISNVVRQTFSIAG